MRDALDPKGLIREAYRIEGITPGECRSIFLDWALSVDEQAEPMSRIEALIARYDDQPEHPMTEVLREGLQSASRPRRRGGWRARER